MTLILKSIEKVYHSPTQAICALKNISLKVEDGESLSVLGRFKAGKTSLLRCMSLVEKPTSGSLHMGGNAVSYFNKKSLNDFRKTLGYMPHPPAFLSSRTVYENIALPLEFSGINPAYIRENLNSLISFATLNDLLKLYPTQLSLFQKQRVALVRALSTKPKILFCDDPTQGLDQKSAITFLQLLHEAYERYKFTLVIATEELEVVKALCKRMAVLHLGQIVEQGPVASLLANPQSEITKEFIKVAARSEMPANLRRRLKAQPDKHSHPILRLSFIGATLQEPALAQVIRDFGLSINILQAHLETLVNQTLGIMVMEMRGQVEFVNKAIRFLEEKGLNVEVLGYVTPVV